MYALTVRQPWAWAIIHGGKDVENRTWATPHRGPLAIHAASRIDPDGYAFCRSLGLTVPDDVETSAIIGIVDVLDCTRGAASPWAVHEMCHWRLARPRPIEPFTCRGRMGLFVVERALQYHLLGTADRAGG